VDANTRAEEFRFSDTDSDLNRDADWPTIELSQAKKTIENTPNTLLTLADG